MTIISPKIREAMERKTTAELQAVVADGESWTPPAVEAAREELQRRGMGEKPPWVEWMARWPGRAAFAEEDDAPEAADGGEKPLEHYLEIVESRCLYCGAREPLQFHPFVVSARPSEELPRVAAATAVRMVGRSLDVVGAGLVSAMVGRAILDEGRATESLLLHLVLCDGCAREAVNEHDEFPPEVYGLHPWVEPLAQVGYEVMVLAPDRPTMVQAAKQLMSPPSAIGIRMV
jgi:hypothetical protein